MTYGAPGIDAGTANAFSADADDPALFAHATRAPSKPVARHRCLSDLAEWLPRLGPVLWLQRDRVRTDAQACVQPSSTLLLDHPACQVLATCTQLRAYHAIAAHGPREWLCFHAPNGTIEARLFLLPDSDVLEWDNMSVALELEPGAADRHDPPTHCTFLGRALSRFGQRWQARLLEFRCLQRPWLSVIDAQPPLRISLLGIDIARGIVRDEYAEWISPQLS